MKTKYRMRGIGGPVKPLSTYYVMLPMCYYKWLLLSRQPVSRCSELVNVCIKPRQLQLSSQFTWRWWWLTFGSKQMQRNISVIKKLVCHLKSNKNNFFKKNLHGLTSLYRLRFLFSGNLATLHGSSHDCWRISCGKLKTVRINMTLTWSSEYPGTQSDFFHCAFFFKGHLYHISSLFILSDHILFVSGAQVEAWWFPQTSHLNKCPRAVQLEAVRGERQWLVAEAFERTLLRRSGEKLTCWSETCVRGAHSGTWRPLGVTVKYWDVPSRHINHRTDPARRNTR